MSIVAQQRKCKKCKELKSLLDFPKHKLCRDGRASTCRVCTDVKRRSDPSYPEKKLAQSRKWYANNIEKAKDSIRKWVFNNPEKRKAIVRNRYHKNAEQINISKRKNRAKNPELYRATARALYARNLEENREKKQLAQARRDARIRSVGGDISAQEWRELKEKYGYVCLRCKRKEPEIKLTIDHIVPIAKGGSNTIENAQPLCLSCNSSKHVKVIDYR